MRNSHTLRTSQNTQPEVPVGQRTPDLKYGSGFLNGKEMAVACIGGDCWKFTLWGAGESCSDSVVSLESCCYKTTRDGVLGNAAGCWVLLAAMHCRSLVLEQPAVRAAGAGPWRSHACFSICRTGKQNPSLAMSLQCPLLTMLDFIPTDKGKTFKRTIFIRDWAIKSEFGARRQ